MRTRNIVVPVCLLLRTRVSGLFGDLRSAAHRISRRLTVRECRRDFRISRDVSVKKYSVSRRGISFVSWWNNISVYITVSLLIAVRAQRRGGSCWVFPCGRETEKDCCCGCACVVCVLLRVHLCNITGRELVKHTFTRKYKCVAVGVAIGNNDKLWGLSL